MPHKGPRKQSNGTHPEEKKEEKEKTKEEGEKKEKTKEEGEEKTEEEKKEEEKKGPQGEAGGFKLDGYASL